LVGRAVGRAIGQAVNRIYLPRVVPDLLGKTRVCPYQFPRGRRRRRRRRRRRVGALT
jgi:hypothetical protein